MMLKNLALAMVRYWSTVILSVLALCLLEGNFLYLQKPHVWVLVFAGSCVYAVLTWRDSKNGKDVKFSGGSTMGDLAKAVLIVLAAVGVATLLTIIS